MSELVVIVYSTETKAEAARRTLLDMQKEYLIEPGDAVVATKNAAGQIKLNQLFEPVRAGVVVSDISWGSLIGLLFSMPLAGAASRAGSDAIGGKITELGIDDNFLMEAGKALRSEHATLFLLIRQMTADKVVAALRGTGGKILRTSFDESQEEDLQAALAELRSVHVGSDPPVKS
ncbi:MAG TPA: DUF1269 domain-containing protein [Acetobacteraceae bacterium]|nr:DUF1269 domain-containing protein [Acetobacteraceae bacterium]